MTTAVLDTLRCAQTLKTAGFTQEQAEATAQVLGDALSDVATKADVDRLEAKIDDVASTATTNLDQAVAGLEAKIDQAVSTASTNLDHAVAGLEAKIDSLDHKFETKFDAVNQRLDSMETSTQKQFASVQEQLGSFRDQFRHQARVTYILLGIIAGLVFGSLVAPYLPWDRTPAATPAAAESPAAAPEAHSPPAQTGAEGEPLVNPAEPPPPSSAS
ncbi:MAG: hypothetical protein F4Y86_14360 [Gammaproteobacteria bacterium]|nr:hypothetical protein [Gammaproteobacteria bacterium]